MGALHPALAPAATLRRELACATISLAQRQRAKLAWQRLLYCGDVSVYVADLPSYLTFMENVWSLRKKKVKHVPIVYISAPCLHTRRNKKEQGHSLQTLYI